MQTTLLSNGRLRVQDQFGYTYEIGSEHPDFQRLRAQYQQTAKRNWTPARLFGLLMIAIGVAAWWYNWHLHMTQGQFYIKAIVLGPLGVFGGLLVLLRPEWAGPLRKDGTRSQKNALIAVIGLVVVASGIDMYFHLRDSKPSTPAVTPWTPSMGTPKFDTPSSSVDSGTVDSGMTFLGHPHRLASFSHKQHDMWEFVTPGQTIDNWTTLLTIIDRQDAHTRQELDRMAEGIMGTYKSNGGQVLSAKTMQGASGDVFNYMVVAFDESSKRRYELNFVKMALGPKNALVMVYGVRITDPRDYRTKAKEFLDRSSGEVGHALGTAALPDIAKLPRRVF